MNGTDLTCVVLSPLLWLGYSGLGESVVGSLMGFAAMFATVYALMAVLSWGIDMVNR